MNKLKRQKITPPELAGRWGIGVDKVLCWIRSGELRAIDASTTRGGRPRYRIDEVDVADFERRRSVIVKPTAQKRPRERDKNDVIEFF